ncbi:thiamine diphosphokinase [Amphibacillus sediminis]|uniref:thiamine diphosphokinase n=1 Tax=Amphibacillus sediminis TaxID=360185 RepID=UPI00082C7CC9|nr:thiamine diphosphokinase [Amphibacillus sediminis]
MTCVAIVAGGPKSLLANLKQYNQRADYWIGCDQGAQYLLDYEQPIDLAIGDFDSVSADHLTVIKQHANQCAVYPIEKDLTDLELAVEHAMTLAPKEILIFGVTGGRLDHELASLFLLTKLVDRDVKVTIIDTQNEMTIYNPGHYQITKHPFFNKVSFLALSNEVIGLTLKGFYYPLVDHTLQLGDSLALSNHLISNCGTFSFKTGILIVIKSSEQNH